MKSVGRSEKMGQATATPLGVIPKQIWKEQRIQALCRAISDYVGAGKVQEELGYLWSCELQELLKEVKDGDTRIVKV